MMKFELMYYLGMRYNELMTLDIAELQWYYKQLREVKEQEHELEKTKLEAIIAAVSISSAKKQFVDTMGMGE